MYFHEVPRDREPESQPAMLSSRRAIGLSKSLKDVRQELPTDAAACIGHTHLNCGTSPSDLHTNTPTPVSKLHRIRQQIPNHLLEPRSEEHTSELQSQFHLVCRLLLE